MSEGGPTVETVSADEARRMALRAQGLLGRLTGGRRVSSVLDQLGAIQLDTISVLARSHELVCHSRLGPLPRVDIDQAMWGRGPSGEPNTVEYWAHAACILPISTWPWLAFRRRHYRNSARWQLAATPDALADVRRRLEAEGPLTASGLGGAKRGGPWWDWSPIKVAVEVLLDWGEVVCTRRSGWKRVYDLVERALPARLLDHEPSDEECFSWCVRSAGDHLGVGTGKDLADYYRLTRAQFQVGVAASGLVRVHVDGWRDPAWASPLALEKIASRGRHRTTLLSPFDSLVWEKPRTERIFGLAHRIEAYTPAPKRVHGYYAMPVLAGGRLVGRVDPGRAGRTLVAKQVGIIDPRAVPEIGAALREASEWVGCDAVSIGLVDPPELKGVLETALRETS